MNLTHLAVAAFALTASCKSSPEPAPAAPSTASSGSATAAEAPETGLPKEGLYLLRETDLRCVAAPCPYYEAKDPAAAADAEPIKFHGVELSALELDDKGREKLQGQLRKGVRAWGRFELQKNAGPAGDAVVFWVKELRD